jgi:uncharacterized protein YbcV (DUF1398 family)
MMQSQVRNALHDCTADSDGERLTFPQLIARLLEIGVEGYYADLQRAEKTYYVAKGQNHVVPTAAIGVPPASTFSAPAVKSAVRAIGCRELTYLEFCRQLAAAGCVGYYVSLPARRVVYYGKHGESHVEQFAALSC